MARPTKTASEKFILIAFRVHPKHLAKFGKSVEDKKSKAREVCKKFLEGGNAKLYV